MIFSDKSKAKISDASAEVQYNVLDPFDDLEEMLDPNGKGYVILDGVDHDSPTISESLHIETE